MKKTTVYVLEKDGIKCVNFDIDSLCDQIKMEFEDQDFDSMKNEKYNISMIEMSEKEMVEMGEFDGF